MCCKDELISPENIHTFFKTLTIEQAREHLDTYTVEQVRQLWEQGAFGEGPRADGFKRYMVERITKGDRLE